MTPDSIDKKKMAKYRESLILSLRLKDVPGDRIGQIVAEVESHVADTGEDPFDAFGSPRAYADHLTAGRRREPWWHIALNVLPAGIAGWFVVRGALALMLGETYLGQSGWLWLGFGLIVGIPAGVSVHRRSTPVRDPRTGADMLPMSRWGLAGLIVPPLAIILLAWAAIEILGTQT